VKAIRSDPSKAACHSASQILYGASLNSLSRTTRSYGSLMLLTRYSNSPLLSGSFLVMMHAPPRNVLATGGIKKHGLTDMEFISRHGAPPRSWTISCSVDQQMNNFDLPWQPRSAILPIERSSASLLDHPCRHPWLEKRRGGEELRSPTRQFALCALFFVSSPIFHVALAFIL
jgi:hypothetical protein